MQASKIEINQVYAISIDGKLERFHVARIVSTRTANNPHGIKSVVHGWVHRDVGAGIEASFSAERVLGPYKEYSELVEREAAQRRERDERAEQIKARRESCAALLRNAVHSMGVEGDGIKAQYSGIEIPDKVIPALTDYLNQIKEVVP